MSTKTSIKRIALVAVSALGLGVLTSVAPASASANDFTSLSAGVSAPARVGLSSGLTTITAALGSTGAETVTAQITAAPALSTAAALTIGTATGGDSVTSGRSSSTVHTNAVAVSTDVAYATFTAAATTAKFTVALNADVAGTYQILVSGNGNTTTGFSSGLKSVTYSVTTAGSPTSISVSSYGGAAVATGLNGQLFKVSLKDAAGNATVLGLNEGITLTNSDTTNITMKNRANGATISSFGSGDDYVGAYYVRALAGSGATDGTSTITFAGNGLLASTLTTQATVNQVTAVAATGTAALACTTAANCPSDKTLAGGEELTVSGLTNSTTSAAVVVPAEISDKYGMVYSSALTLAKGETTGTISVPAVDSTYTSASVTVKAVTYTLTYQKQYTTTLAVVGNSAALSATGGKNTWVVKATDQYGNAMQYVPVAVTVAGRNTVASTALGVTDATGFISYSLTDAGTSGTKDTFTFSTTNTNASSSAVSSVTATVTYGTITVGTVTIKGGNNTTTGVAATTAQWKDINAGTSGATATTSDVIATVKDANGSLVAGVPVSFTVSGTGAAITSTTATVLTGTDGTATAKVYAWVAGKYTVTATAGGKTGTSDYQFRQSGSGEERAISASVSGNLVTAKVVDRFGNPVPSVTVYASVTGGYLGSGTLKANDTTDNDGLVSFIVNGGASTVTLATYNAATATAPYGSGQTCARAGAADCNVDAADDTAFTASVAGTALVNEKGVGASFAAAGVASASVDVAAAGASDSVDAANEATDAANAATDAANAAAEAADAATAAAQDAQAAVAALATSVASLIAGIKAQITTLTNLVIKIQKKVRA